MLANLARLWMRFTKAEIREEQYKRHSGCERDQFEGKQRLEKACDERTQRQKARPGKRA